jgi:acyl carrier protein
MGALNSLLQHILTDIRKDQMIQSDETLAKVRQAFKAAFDVDPQSVTMETSASDIPLWDSVGHLSLASSLEEVFGITLDVDDLMEMENVREIVRVITPKLAQKA